MNKYYINPLSILFVPPKDALNGYETIACNWDKEEFIKINRPAYKILRTVKENPGLTLDKLLDILQKDVLKLNRFLEDMVTKNINI